jgi:hypothetical protein
MLVVLVKVHYGCSFGMFFHVFQLLPIKTTQWNLSYANKSMMKHSSMLVLQ